MGFELIGYIILCIYVAALVYITIYCLMQFHLLFHYKKYHSNKENQIQRKPDLNGHNPFVTIQLPIYNELHVVKRLISNIVLIDYPRDKFEVQVLDDSTDETKQTARELVKKYQAEGFQIHHYWRKERTGFKAGALKEGMKKAKGKYIAIFDADFLPSPDFLQETLPYFQNKRVGVVQTRWGHINQNYSLITELQAFQLNVHFTVEQQGRQAGKLMLQFNGTAGIWRRESIESSGGWEADTLTEDLDLSYRAQLNGWEIIYLEDIVSPAELPSEMSGLKSQQFRWMKGGAETAKKMLPSVWKSGLNMQQKIHASMHLLSSSIFLFVFILGVFSVPLVFILTPLGIDNRFFTLFLIGLMSIVAVYYVANVQAAENKKSKSGMKLIWKFLVMFPLFLALSMGLSLHNSVAVLQGYLGRKSAFVRTPKFNNTGLAEKLKKGSYLDTSISSITVLEGLLAIYFIIGIIADIIYRDMTFTGLHVLLVFGYSAIFFLSLKHFNFASSRVPD